MTRFGEILRTFREAGNDPDRFNKRLTQKRLGKLMGIEMGDLGFSGSAISYWESGESKISAQDRSVLMALIKVLHRCGGLKTVADANRLLRAGSYRELDTDETEKIFGELRSAADAHELKLNQESSKSFLSFWTENVFSLFDVELKKLLDDAEEGPRPVWPRLLAVLMRKTSEQISFSPKAVLWIGIWWLAWWLIAPSMRWPFADRAAALQAIGMYVVGTLVVPLLIGSLIDTKHNDYWIEQGIAHSRLLRLYTYQGASIGFNLAYFFVLPLVLVKHYFDLVPSNWPAVIAVTLGLILANMGARVVPHNLWLVYHRLRLGDGAVFFVVALIGPLWGLFFLEYYPILLTPFWGAVVILAALLLFILIPVGRSPKKMDTEQAQP